MLFLVALCHTCSTGGKRASMALSPPHSSLIIILLIKSAAKHQILLFHKTVLIQAILKDLFVVDFWISFGHQIMMCDMSQLIKNWRFRIRIETQMGSSSTGHTYENQADNLHLRWKRCIVFSVYFCVHKLWKLRKCIVLTHLNNKL